MKPSESKILGVLGGLGPMASAYFYQLVTEHTTAGCDQEHIDMVIASRATTPDRTAFIVGTSGDDPFVVMEEEAKKLVAYGAGVLAIPCNTAHYFYDRLENTVPVPVLHMVERTVDKVLLHGGKKVAIFATDGTVSTHTYQRVCDEKGLAWQVPDEDAQKQVMDIIYSIKAGEEPQPARLMKLAAPMEAASCTHMILGCTELSLLKRGGALPARYIDSMEVLAEAVILACGKTPRGFEFG